MAEKFDSFLKEVDDDLRRDQLKKLWDQYGVFAVAGLVLILFGVWGQGYWQSRRLAAAEAIGAQYEAASALAREGKGDEALKAFGAIAGSAAPGYQGLAQLRVAGVHARAGRVTEAVAAYDSVAKNSAVDQLLRELAGVQAASLLLDTVDYAEIERRLTPLTADSGLWRSAARETLALAAFKAGKLDDARKLYDKLLGDRGTPGGMNDRVQLMLAVLTDAEAARPSPQSAPAAAEPGKGPEKSMDKSKGPAAAPKK